MRTTKLPSTWYSTVPMNKPLSLVRYNYVGACKMHACSSGKCHTQIYHQDGGHTIGAGNALSMVSWVIGTAWVMGTANRVKGRAVVILSMDATHLWMADGEQGQWCGGDEGSTTNSSRSAGIDMCILRTKRKLQ